MSSAIEQPQTQTRRVAEGQFFWQPGFCENQLTQCSWQIEKQKGLYPWIQMEEMLARFDAVEDGTIAALRQLIANFAAVDYSDVPNAVGTLADIDDAEAIHALQQASDQLNGIDFFSALPEELWSTLDAIENAIVSIASLLGSAALAGIYAVQDTLQFLRLIVAPPVAIFTVIQGVGKSLVALMNSVFSLLTGRDEIVGYSFCAAELFGCSLEILSRYLIITVTGAVLSIVS